MNLLGNFAYLWLEAEPVKFFAQIMNPLRVNFILDGTAILDQEVLCFVVALSAYHAAHVVDLRPETKSLQFCQVLLALGSLHEGLHLVHPPHSTLIQLLAVIFVIALPSPRGHHLRVWLPSAVVLLSSFPNVLHRIASSLLLVTGWIETLGADAIRTPVVESLLLLIFFLVLFGSLLLDCCLVKPIVNRIYASWLHTASLLRDPGRILIDLRNVITLSFKLTDVLFSTSLFEPFEIAL